MSRIVILLFLLVSSFAFSQQKGIIYPQFKECDTIPDTYSCFNNTFLSKVKDNFRVPSVADSVTANTPMPVFFEVNSAGSFKLLYSDVSDASMKKELQRVFDTLPKITPAQVNGQPTYMQFRMTLTYPFDSVKVVDNTNELYFTQQIALRNQHQKDSLTDEFTKIAEKAEYDKIVNHPYQNKEFASNLNVPFQHQRYAVFDPAMNMVGNNAHTASKPFLFKDVATYYDYEGYTNSLMQQRQTWLGRKFWNEHFASIIGQDYWINFDIVADLRLGRDTYSKTNTYNNTRAVQVQGGLGKDLNFYTTIYESQGRFASYFNDYAESMAPDGGNPAIIPGRGIAKAFKTDSYDYPVAEAYLSYSPGKVFNFQFGNGKNFIGDGYRSLLISDAASPYPFFKINTTFWKFKYTNTYMWLKDVRRDATVDGAFLTKYMATHYLSWNVSKKLNLGFFESVIWKNDNNRGFDVSYVNPIIFYRAMEFYSGSRSGNALMGLTGKYKWNDHLNLYGQFVLDELSTSDITGGQKSWKNKYGYQVGAKYYNAFGVKDLTLQWEYNQVRPYTYSHEEVEYNYGHNNQSMAHLWGSNFKEFTTIANYRYDRWFGYGKITVGAKGFDFNTADNTYSYGGDIYRSYNDRVNDTGISMLQGNKTNIFIGELQGGYVINPVDNLRLYVNVLFRNFDPNANTADTFKQNTTWFNIGFRTDLFNWYEDF